MTTSTQSKTNKKTLFRSGLLVLALSLTFIGVAIHGADAAGPGTLSLSPTSGTYTVGDTITVSLTENSASEAVNAVEADLTYNPSVLEYVSVNSAGSAFPDYGLVSFPTSGSVNISRAIFGTSLTNSRAIASVTFKVIAPASSTSVSYASSSQLVRQSDTQNVWNGAIASASFVTKAVVVATTPTPTPTGTGSTGSSSTGNTSTPKTSSGGSAATTKSSSGAAATNTPSAATTTNDPTVPIGTTEFLPENSYLVAIYVRNSDNKPVQGATVTLQGKTAKTDSQGMAGFVAVPVGSYDVKVTYNGKTETQKVSVTKPATDGENLQKFTLKLASAHSSSSWLIYAIVLLVILGLGAAGFIIPRKNRFKGGPSSGTPVSPEQIVVGDTSSKTSNPTPETIIRPTINTPSDTNSDEDNKA